LKGRIQAAAILGREATCRTSFRHWVYKKSIGKRRVTGYIGKRHDEAKKIPKDNGGKIEGAE